MEQGGMKLISTAIAAYRHFSTNTATKSTKWNYRRSTMNSPKNPKRTRVKWTEEQLQVFAAVSSGKSIFITGSAGTGKTALLQSVIRRLKKLYDPSEVFVTGSTGVAACALRGLTLHSFAGIGLCEGDPAILLHKVLSDKKAYNRWNKARALVIDEISMIDAEIFSNLEYIAREIRAKEQGVEMVWGGIQLVVSGDFFQLPPVVDRKKSREKVYAFEADCWALCFDIQIELTKNFRQSEPELVKVLENIRKGKSELEDLELLNKCCSKTVQDPLVVQLFPLCKDVNRVNKERIEKLETYIRVYHALDSGEYSYMRQLKRGIAPDELTLTEGARVMLCKNLNPWRKLVNGSTGTVVEFCDTDKKSVSDICKDNGVPLVKFDSGLEMKIYPETWYVMEGENIVASRKQLPLILAWAFSVHKCQGMTLDKLHTDLSKAFDFGMVYVALSRVRSLDGLHLSGLNPLKIKVHPKVLKFYENFSSKQDKQGEGDVYEDKSRSFEGYHVPNNGTSRRMNPNGGLILHCKPNLSLISWNSRATKR